NLMVPPASWRPFVDEVRRYLIEVVGLADDDALDTVIAVQHALLPARDRAFPMKIELAHDYAAWHAAVLAKRDEGDRDEWHEVVSALRTYGPAIFEVDDPLESCQRSLGSTYDYLSEDSAWDLQSPVSRMRQAVADVHDGETR